MAAHREEAVTLLKTITSGASRVTGQPSAYPDLMQHRAKVLGSESEVRLRLTSNVSVDFILCAANGTRSVFAEHLWEFATVGSDGVNVSSRIARLTSCLGSL